MKTFLATSTLALLVAASGFLPASVVTSSPAEAVVCARGVVRAGCAGPRGAVVVRRAPVVVVRPPAAVAACRWVNGRKVCGVVR